MLADSVGLALLVVLETLSAAERLAFVLHDMFAVPFDEIAPIVERSPEAARQLASRARRRVQGENPVPDADLEIQRESSTRSSRPRATATSRRWSRCSTRTSCCARTSAPADGRIEGGSRGRGGRRPGAHLLTARPGRAAGARQRRRRRRVDARRRAVLGRGLHGQGREDRRDRLPRRPRAPPPARPDGPRRLRVSDPRTAAPIGAAGAPERWPVRGIASSIVRAARKPTIARARRMRFMVGSGRMGAS